MTPGGIGMAAELREAPDVVRRQDNESGALLDLVARCRRHPPQIVVTCARGSSAHAATFGKHLIERHLGIPVAEAAPNIATVYRRRLKLSGQLLLTISQSGRSDDLVEFSLMARSAGATTVAIVNDPASPLAAACDVALAMAAGPERSIAATKSFIASLTMLLRITAVWADDADLRAAIDRLPDRLTQAAELDWSGVVESFAKAASLMTIGRGPTLPVAREAALKFKETCHLHAEAFSSAEFQHGPVALVSARYPILMFVPTDAAETGMEELGGDLRAKGAALFSTGRGGVAADRLPTLPTDHPDADAVCLMQSAYDLAIRLAERRGIDADRPRHLQKVTRTR
jgi:glucosamine--fructose-6-phosphate aminotransferase (isomerizing)